MKKPKLSNEEMRALRTQLIGSGWLADAYSPKNGKRHLKPTKWGQRHYQKLCMLTDVDKMFSGPTLKQLERQKLGYETLGDRHLYHLDLLQEVFDDERYHDTKELTRRGYEWVYAYTKLKGTSIKKYGAKHPLTYYGETLLAAMVLVLVLIAEGLIGRKKK